jgi:gliding motility-associatede transport system auxiliary component
MASENELEQRDSGIQSAYLILLTGGLIGGALVLASIVTSYWWWGPLLNFLKDSDREKLWQPLVALVGLLVGLAIMFGAFQSARRFERIDVTLRRVLYGYSTCLQLLLLGIFIATVTVFVQIRYPAPFDMTEGGFYSLSEKTRQFLTSLDKPVQVYMLLVPGDSSAPGAYQGMKTVLSEMEDVNPRYFHYEEISIEDTRPNSRVRDLMKRFSRLNGQRPGLLVTYGDNPENNQSYIAANELVNMEYGRNRQPQRSFNGEVRLMQELYFLAEDKHRPVIYVTQGHGEPDIGDRNPDGLAELVQRLQEANYDVHGLTTTSPDPEKNSVPADAEVVLILGPKRSMNDMIPGLRRYMNPTDPKTRKGKLVVLLGPTEPDRQRGNRMTDTGLEPFLREFNIDATNEQILTFAGPGGRPPIGPDGAVIPEAVFVGALRSATQERNPLAMLIRGESLTWLDVRRIEALPSQQGSKFQADPLIATVGYCWVETDMQKQFGRTWHQINQQDESAPKVTSDSRTVLAAVAESPPSAEANPGQTKQSQLPRLVVGGCSNLATNQFVRRESGGIAYDLIRGSIDWCRERYANIGVEPKSYRYFVLNSPGSYWDIFYLPVAAMTLAVFGLGMIVWNIRRR